MYDDDRLPPRREQLPLPRRAGQTHLEPQLREPGGTGTGTPFAAFDPDRDAPDPARAPAGERAAAFRDATRRAGGQAPKGPAAPR